MQLITLLSKVNDDRKSRGKRYNLSSALVLVISGLSCGYNTLASIHRWGKRLGHQALINMGFYDGKLMCYSNLTIVLRKANCDDITKIMQELSDSGTKQILNTDGKFLKKSDSFGSNEKTQILTMFNSETGVTTGYQEIENKDEYQAMLNLLKKSDIKDAIITADAAFAHQEILDAIKEKGADFAITLKGNEPNLLRYTINIFTEAVQKGITIRSYKEETDCNHGRIEQRSIEVIDMPFEYLNGHRHITQLCKITRYRELKNTGQPPSEEEAYMITSVSCKSSPEFLLHLNRGHWGCENKLNWVKDNVFLEDNSTISTGKAPNVMSLLRSFSLQIIRTVSNKITETREMFNHKRWLLWRKLNSLEKGFKNYLPFST